MATRVQAKNSADLSVASLAFDSNVTSGNLIVVWLRVSNGDGTPTGLTDSVGTTYSQIGTSLNVTGGNGYLYYGVAAGSGANTVSIGGGATSRIVMEEVSGISSPTIDATAQATGSSSSAASGSITAAANSWVFAGLALNNYPSVAVTAGSGFTSINLADGNKYGAEDRDFAAGGSVNGQFTLPESNTWGSIVASFKAAGATNTNIQPSAGSAAFTGYAPTVTRTASASITPSVGALALTGIASTLTLTLPSPDSGSLALTGYAPTVTVTNAQNIQPSAGALSFAGYAPTVTNTSSRNVSPAVGTLTFVGYAPTVTIYVPTRQPSAGSLAFTGYAPSVSVRSPNSGATQQRNRRRRGILNMIWGR